MSLLTENFIKENLMGPDPVTVLSGLAESLNISKGMKILDLGCGKGLTSLYLADRYDVTVFAVDLWVSATDNMARIRQTGLEDRVFPIYADAHSLPFAEGFFDIALSIDSYHYYGTSENYFHQYFAPLVKKGGQLAIAVPGLSHEFENGVPAEFKPFWCPDMNTFHSRIWWRDLWERSGLVDIVESKNLDCHAKAWERWLNSGNEHAMEDVPFFESDVNNRLATVSLVATKK